MPESLILVTFDPADDAALVQAAADTGAQPGVRHFLRTDPPPSNMPTPPSSEITGVWIASPPPPWLLDAVKPLGDRVEAYRVASRPQWNDPDDDPAAGPRPMRMAFITRPATITHADFDRRWAAHAAVAREHQPHIIGYVQHVVDEALTPASRPFDGIGEFEHPRMAPGEVMQRYVTEEGRLALEADIRGFLEHSGSRSVWVRPA